jgi:hypothetical protein
MGGIFSRTPGLIEAGMNTVKKTEPASTSTPEPVAAPAPAAGLGESRAPVTRAATMLSNRRAGDDVRVGTKKLLGQ